MTKILIAIPALGSVPIDFFTSVLNLVMPDNTEVDISVNANALVYVSRNQLAKRAIDKGYDFILWLDSDMVFGPITLINLLESAQKNLLDFVSGIYFKRQLPTAPVIYKSLRWSNDKTTGVIDHGSMVFDDYPKDRLFRISGAGLACTLVRVSAIQECINRFKYPPFDPMPYLGEDLSFCWKPNECGIKMYCDSRVKVGHVGAYVFDEKTYIKEREVYG